MRARHVSNFEVASGYAAAMLIPIWFIVLVAVFWFAYWPLIRWPAVVAIATVVLALFALPIVPLIASLF